MCTRSKHSQGGRFRISLTYDDPDVGGKTAGHTDTYHGHFAELVPNEQLVEVIEFETEDPDLRGEMTMTTTLTDTDGGTDVLVGYEGLPPGVSSEDNELGTRRRSVSSPLSPSPRSSRGVSAGAAGRTAAECSFLRDRKPPPAPSGRPQLDLTSSQDPAGA